MREASEGGAGAALAEPAPAGTAGSTAGLDAVVVRMAEFVLGTCDYERRDRLCPAHFQVFGTNPMSMAFGASGVALFLDRALGQVPDAVRRWMLDQPLGVDTYPPGLFLGLSGIAATFAEIGLPEKGEEVMRECYRSPLLYREPGVYMGAAGWGWASLYFWDRTRRQEYLDHAVLAGEHLLRDAGEEDGNRFWRHAGDGKVHYGFGMGSSGIALFLLYLGVRTGRDDFVEAARRGLDYDLAHKLDTVNGTTWKRFEDDLVNYPYFLHGAAGIGSVVLRFGRVLGGERYRAWAEEIASGIDMKWTVFPGLLHGLSGIGEFVLDMHRYTGEERYLDRARDHAETVLWFQVPTEEGIAFPGRMLLKICNDWATGAAGIGLFLHRLAHPGARWLVDLDGAGPREAR